MAADSPVVSIIIPAYNAQEYLRECLESILAQSFSDWECVIFNDGSTDFTLKIAEEFVGADSRFAVFSGENKGLAESRNRALEHCSGEWVTMVDADDCLLPGALQSLVCAALTAEADVIVGRFATEQLSAPCQELNLSWLPVEDAIENVLYQRCGAFPSAWGKLYRRTLISTEKFTPGIWYEDLDWFYRIYLKANRIAFIDAEVYFYRQHPGSFLHIFRPSRFDVLRVTEKIEDAFRENPRLLAAARDRRLSASFNMLGLIHANCPHDFPEQRQECMSVIKLYGRQSLLNKKVRLKNKLGYLLFAVSPKLYIFIAKYLYRK